MQQKRRNRSSMSNMEIFFSNAALKHWRMLLPFSLKYRKSQIRDIGLCMFLSITHNDCLSVKFLIRD